MPNERYILTISCIDTRGIVAAVSGFLAKNYGFIIESAQFGDSSTNHFFMRVEFALQSGAPSYSLLRAYFAEQIATPFEMEWEIYDKSRKSRLLILVSKHGHCLNDLLHRNSTEQLPIEIAGVFSNHEDMRRTVELHGLPYYYETSSKEAQEEKIISLIKEMQIDLVVLGRYMQILSPNLCANIGKYTINIHHSFLPSFKGARPYHQAYEHGVKLIGATAHYITNDLDEGPIIEQEVARVDHANNPDQLAAIGRDIECLVLSRAVKYHAEHRVLLNGKKTVVFR